MLFRPGRFLWAYFEWLRRSLVATTCALHFEPSPAVIAEPSIRPLFPNMKDKTAHSRHDYSMYKHIHNRHNILLTQYKNTPNPTDSRISIEAVAYS